MSGAFGYEETKGMDGKKTLKKLKKMGLDTDDAKKRTIEFGKDPSGKRKNKVSRKIRAKKGFIDKLTLIEKEEEIMIKMLEDALVDKKKDNEILKKEKNLFTRLLKSEINKVIDIAKNEGISIKEIIKFILRKDDEHISL